MPSRHRFLAAIKDAGGKMNGVAGTTFGRLPARWAGISACGRLCSMNAAGACGRGRRDRAQLGSMSRKCSVAIERVGICIKRVIQIPTDYVTRAS